MELKLILSAIRKLDNATANTVTMDKTVTNAQLIFIISTLVLGKRDIQPCDGFCYVHKSNSTLIGECDIDPAVMKMHEAVRKISGSSLILTIVSSFIILIILLLGYVWLRLRPRVEDFSRSSTYLT